MKKFSILNLISLSSLLALLFTGCLNSNMIKISKKENGQTLYSLTNKVKPEVQKFQEYNNWDIHSYYMNVYATNDDVKIQLVHHLGFTIGSGVPSEAYVKGALYHKLKDFKIIGLESKGEAVLSDNKSLLIDWWYENASHLYSKKDFIDFVLNNNAPEMEIMASKLEIKSKFGSKKIKILGIKNLKRFALCLENNETCMDKEEE